MIQYKVRAPETSGTRDVEKIINDEARDGWRLVSTNVESTGRRAAACGCGSNGGSMKRRVPEPSIAELVRASRLAQGLPEHVEDTSVLRKIAALVEQAEQENPEEASEGASASEA